MQKTLLILAMVLVLTVTMVCAAATLQVPAASATVSLNQTLNITLAVGDDVYINCSFWAFSASTANSTYQLLGTDINNTKNDTTFNYTWDPGLQKLEDSNDYTFKGACSNLTGTELSDTSTSVTVDMTDPTAATSLSPTDGTTDADSASTFSGTVTDAVTTGCTLVFDGANPGSKSYSMTYATTSCTIDLSNIANGWYKWYIVASDGTDTTNSVKLDVQFDNPKVSPGAKVIVLGGTPLSQGYGDTGGGGTGVSKNMKMLGALLLLGGLGYYLMNKK